MKLQKITKKELKTVDDVAYWLGEIKKAEEMLKKMKSIVNEKGMSIVKKEAKTKYGKITVVSPKDTIEYDVDTVEYWFGDKFTKKKIDSKKLTFFIENSNIEEVWADGRLEDIQNKIKTKKRNPYLKLNN